MYFSKINKNHMFQTLTDLIYKETNVQIKDSHKYIELYRLHYPSIFESIDTDEISILNKEIIDKIGQIILNEMNSSDLMNSSDSMNSSDLMNSSEPVNDIISSSKSEQVRKRISIYSSKRNINSLNRYNFTVPVTFMEFKPETITLLKEQNSLFGNPNINILFNDTDNILFKLKDIMKLDNHEYYNYECLTDDNISSVNHSLKIQIRNYLMNDPLQESDLYTINKSKIILYEKNEYLCLEIDNHDIKEDEELGLLYDDKIVIDKIVTSLFVKKIFQNYVLTNKTKLDLSKEYKCLQMNKNITIMGLSDSYE